MTKNKFCIACDLPDGINVFAGFHKKINPITGASTYFNVWDTDVSNAKLFRSAVQASNALKMVDRDGNVKARVEPFDAVIKAANSPENVERNQSQQN